MVQPPKSVPSGLQSRQVKVTKSWVELFGEMAVMRMVRSEMEVGFGFVLWVMPVDGGSVNLF